VASSSHSELPTVHDPASRLHQRYDVGPRSSRYHGETPASHSCAHVAKRGGRWASLQRQRLLTRRPSCSEMPCCSAGASIGCPSRSALDILDQTLRETIDVCGIDRWTRRRLAARCKQSPAIRTALAVQEMNRSVGSNLNWRWQQCDAPFCCTAAGRHLRHELLSSLMRAPRATRRGLLLFRHAVVGAVRRSLCRRYSGHALNRVLMEVETGHFAPFRVWCGKTPCTQPEVFG
jgi:hypothetical protein